MPSPTQPFTADNLRGARGAFKGMYLESLGRGFPQDARVQLRAAIEAVFRSWETRAQRSTDDSTTSRTRSAPPSTWSRWCSATRASGLPPVSRSRATRGSSPHGEFLVDAQGEDVVAGIRAPQPLEQLEQVLPGAYADLQAAMEVLEQHYRNVRDRVEFTIEQGTLYILQTRSAKRTGAAALRMHALDMVHEGLVLRARKRSCALSLERSTTSSIR